MVYFQMDPWKQMYTTSHYLQFTSNLHTKYIDGYIPQTVFGSACVMMQKDILRQISEYYVIILLLQMEVMLADTIKVQSD